MIIYNDHWTLLWNSPSLVCVKWNWVWELSSIKKALIPMLISKRKEATPAAINVMPEVVLLANGRDSSVVIIAAHDSGPGHWVYKEWFVALSNLSLDHLLEGFDAHSTSKSIARNTSHLVHAHSTHHSASGNRVMRLDWGEGYWSIFWLPSLKPNMWESQLSRTKDGHHVWHTATWIKTAVNIFPLISESLSEKFDAFNFHDREYRWHVVHMNTSV